MREEQKNFYNNFEKYYITVKGQGKEYFAEYLSFISYYINKGKSILDIGCGTGQSTYYLSQLGYKSSGLDGSSRFVKFAKKKYQELDFINADAENLPFTNEIFDVVASYNTVEHFSNAKKCLKEMIRVVKKGGDILLLILPTY